MRKPVKQARYIFLLALFLFSTFLFAEGIVPYEGEPPKIELSDLDRDKLERFEPVYPPIQDDGNAGGGQAVFRVKARPEIIWQVIEDFNNYPKYNKDLDRTKYYVPVQDSLHFVQFTTTKFFTTVKWHVKHFFPGVEAGYATWELDKSKKNNLTECIGFWRVDAVPGTDFSDVSYSVNLASNGFLFNLFKGLLIHHGVKKATQWLKIEAEKRAGTD